MDKAHKFLGFADIRTKIVKLRASWPTFVMITVDQGLDGYYGGLQDLKYNLSTALRSETPSSSRQEAVVKVFKRDGLVVA